MEYCESEKPRVKRGDLQLLESSDVARLAAMGKALSEPIRLQMIKLLEQREDLCTCEFEELLGLSQSKVSYHLNILLEAGFVTRQFHGTWSHYSLKKPEVLNCFRAFNI